MLRPNLVKAAPAFLAFTAELFFELTPPCRLEEVPRLNRDLFYRLIAGKTKERFIGIFQARYPQFKVFQATLQRSLGVVVLPQGQTRSPRFGEAGLYRILLDLTRLRSTMKEEYFAATCKQLKLSLQEKPVSAEIDGEKRQLNFF